MTKHSTLGSLLYERCYRHPQDPAIGWIDNHHLQWMNFSFYWDQVEILASALLEMGIEHQDKICILGQTSKEWHLCDLGILCAGGVTVPLYPNYLGEELTLLMAHSDATALFLENEEQAKKILPFLDRAKKIRLIVSLTNLSAELTQIIKSKFEFYILPTFLELGRGRKNSRQDEIKVKVLAQDPKDLATIIYTSGTTGEPKGAMISHEAIVQMIHNLQSFVSDRFDSQDTTLTFLPLSHVFGRVDSFGPIIFGWKTVYAENMGTLAADAKLVRPTLMMAVPRIFEKFYEKVQVKIHNETFFTKKLFHWANQVTKIYFDKIDKDQTPTPFEVLQRHLAFKLVFSKIYNEFGGMIRFFVSGGAPLSEKIFDFCRYCNLTILEGYGLTETVAPATLNPPHRQLRATVGLPLGDVKISFAPDGEILMKSKALFSGYYKMPQESLDAFQDGWFVTGDIGFLNDRGYLQITDRKKDLIITAGGKNIAPQKIENLLKDRPLISHAAVFGDRQKFLVALIGVEKENLLPYLEEANLGTECSYEELAASQRIRQLIQEQIEEVNQNLANFESVKNFAILPAAITTENYLTPSLKMKRKVLAKDFSALLEGLYL